MTFLCIEDNEQFTIEAESMQQAREDAQLWGASVIRALTDNEIESGVISA